MSFPSEEMIVSVEWAASVASAVGFHTRAKRLRHLAVHLEDMRREMAGESPRAKAATGTPSPFSKADCDTLYRAWVDAFGAASYPSFRKAFMPFYEVERGARYPLERLVLAVKWAGALLKEHPRELQFMSPERFAGKVAFWMEVLDWPAESRFARFADAMRGRAHAAA